MDIVANVGRRGFKCHGPKCKARDHGTRCAPWRSIDKMGNILPTRIGPIQRTNKLAGKDDTLEVMVTVLKEKIDELKEELKIFKATLGNGMLASKLKRQAMDVLKSKAFKGARFVSEVDNFLWAMEQYFRAISIEDDATKVNTVAMYFTDVALLWWRRRSIDVRRGGTEIGTWEEFQKEFKAHFYPEYAKVEARAKLRLLT
ncbi:hypothetical protein Gotur_004170 [Gossypium turneri]